MSEPDGGQAHVEARGRARRRLAREARAQATMPAWIGAGAVARMERERRAELLELADELDELERLVPQVAEGVEGAHDVAERLETALRRALGEPALTARATPSWTAVGYDCPTVTIELPVAAADALRERIRRRGRWTWLWRALGIVGR